MIKKSWTASLVAKQRRWIWHVCLLFRDGVRTHGPRFAKGSCGEVKMLCDKKLQDPPAQVPTVRFVPDRLAQVACRWVETRYRRSERKFEAARSGQHLGSIRPIHPFTGLQKYALRAVSWARLDLMRAV